MEGTAMKRVLSAFILSGALAVGAFGLTGESRVAAMQHQHTHDDAVTKSDGSVVKTTVSKDGTRTEVRTFESGDVARVTRTTRSSGERMVIIEYRDGRATRVKQESDIEQAMDATAETIAMYASEAWDKTKDVSMEVADKTEDVADKSVEVGKEVADKTEDVGDATVKGTKKAVKSSKKAGKEVADKAEDVGDKSVEVGKEVADKTEDVADKSVEIGKDVADKSEDVVDKSSEVAQKGVKGTKEKAKGAGNWLKRGFKKIGGWFK
jgi:hypothetical protein